MPRTVSQPPARLHRPTPSPTVGRVEEHSPAEPVLVEVTRSGMTESRHRGSVVALDADGSVALALGDVDSPVYGRSANKPLQAAAMVELGLDVPPDLLALVCASHNGEPVHVEGPAPAGRAGLDASALRNTPSLPLYEPRGRGAPRRWGQGTDPAELLGEARACSPPA